jgi:hypothetical protein
MFVKTLHHFLPIHIQIVWQTIFIILKDELQNEESLNYGAMTITFKEQTIIFHVENLFTHDLSFFLYIHGHHLKPNLSHLATFRHIHHVEPLSWATLSVPTTNIVHTPHKIT